MYSIPIDELAYYKIILYLNFIINRLYILYSAHFSCL